MNILFVCTGNYYRSKFCENVWQYLLEKFNQEGKVSSSGLKPELALLWKEAFGNVSPFTTKALNKIGVPLYDDSSLHLLTEYEVKSNDKIVFINRDEHMPLLSDLEISVPISKIIAWENEDVDQEFPIETLFLMMSNVCDLFQETYKVNTFDIFRQFRSSFYSGSNAFNWRIKDFRTL